MDNPYDQLVIWSGTTLGNNEPEEFEAFFADEGFRIKYAEEFRTLPDEGKEEVTGDRNEILFYVHWEDVPKFSMWRFQHGMRWWEDYLDNGHHKIVPVEILDKYKYGWEKEREVV